MRAPRRKHAGLGILALVLLFTLGFLFIVGSRPSYNRFPTTGSDEQANVVRVSRLDDGRGWLLDPLKGAAEAGLSSVGATSCKSAHVGAVRPGRVRANHRHHFCNETFIIWNARALFRLENKELQLGYAQAQLEADDVTICSSPSGRAHAIVNVDPHRRTVYFMACQDGTLDPNSPKTDYKVWDDLL